MPDQIPAFFKMRCKCGKLALAAATPWYSDRLKCEALQIGKIPKPANSSQKKGAITPVAAG
jgi:hypothetical protein